MDQHLKLDLTKSYNSNATLRDNLRMEQWKVEEINKFLLQLNKDKLKSILDLGAGPGIISNYFKEEGFQVTCIDLSPAMIELCLQKKLHAEVMDFYDLSFPSKSFDAIWSMNSLLHVPKDNLHVVLKNINTVLKDGGIGYVGTYGGFTSEGVWEKDSYRPKRFFSFFTEKEIKKMISIYFEIVSFDIIPLEGDGPDYFSIILRKKRYE
jgi:SAM-dependent methyltransferase